VPGARHRCTNGRRKIDSPMTPVLADRRMRRHHCPWDGRRQTGTHGLETGETDRKRDAQCDEHHSPFLGLATDSPYRARATE